MTLAILYSRAIAGIDSPAVTVEVHLANGLPAFNIVGLPEKAVQESKERVRAAILNSNYEFPTRRITVNLAPADLPKEGGRFDLAIAIGILCASGQLDAPDVVQYELLGELALSGKVRGIKGVLPAAVAVNRSQRSLITATASANEAALISSLQVFAVRHLLDATAFLNKQILLPAHVCKPDDQHHEDEIPDIHDVIGHHSAKRALLIAAAGRHSLLMSGPPGTGKSMLATRLPGLLPMLEENEALESASIRSVAGLAFNFKAWRQRPFRSPHHSASCAALVGGGTTPRPGEISLAHNGILFLDELPEFDRNVLEALREPMENGSVTIARVGKQAQFPARFQLVAAMNPCPCGYLGHPVKACTCTSSGIQRYRRKLSGPLLDRIDIQIEVGPISGEKLVSNHRSGPTSMDLRKQVILSSARQWSRQGKANADLSAAEINHICTLNKGQQLLLQKAIDQLNLSHRAFHRILKLALTISDLDHSDKLETKHLTEALNLRVIDRQITGY